MRRCGIQFLPKVAVATGQDDISSHRKPKGIIADKRDFNEHPDNSKQRQNERKEESEIDHCASPLRCECQPLCLLIAAADQCVRDRAVRFEFAPGQTRSESSPAQYTCWPHLLCGGIALTAAVALMDVF